MFLLVPTYPGCPGSKAVKRSVSPAVTEMRMVRWMCGVKLKDRLPSKELRERLGIDDIALVLQKTDCIGMCMCCEKMMIIG